MRGWWLVLGAAPVLACGRIDFDMDGGGAKDGHGTFADASYRDAVGTVGVDAPATTTGSGSCANLWLGSSLGAVAAGSTIGHADTYSTCGGDGSPDVSYAWVAPSAGSYTIDLCDGPNQDLDTVLTVLSNSCTGPRLACNDDGCGTFLSKARVTASAGELLIIVVDGNDDAGRYVLTITKN